MNRGQVAQLEAAFLDGVTGAKKHALRHTALIASLGLIGPPVVTKKDVCGWLTTRKKAHTVARQTGTAAAPKSRKKHKILPVLASLASATSPPQPSADNIQSSGTASSSSSASLSSALPLSASSTSTQDKAKSKPKKSRSLSGYQLFSKELKRNSEAAAVVDNNPSTTKKPRHASILQHSQAASLGWKELDEEARNAFNERAKTVDTVRKRKEHDPMRDAISLIEQAAKICDQSGATLAAFVLFKKASLSNQAGIALSTTDVKQKGLFNSIVSFGNDLLAALNLTSNSTVSTLNLSHQASLSSSLATQSTVALSQTSASSSASAHQASSSSSASTSTVSVSGSMSESSLTFPDLPATLVPNTRSAHFSLASSSSSVGLGSSASGLSASQSLGPSATPPSLSPPSIRSSAARPSLSLLSSSSGSAVTLNPFTLTSNAVGPASHPDRAPVSFTVSAIPSQTLSSMVSGSASSLELRQDEEREIAAALSNENLRKEVSSIINLAYHKATGKRRAPRTGVPGFSFAGCTVPLQPSYSRTEMEEIFVNRAQIRFVPTGPLEGIDTFLLDAFASARARCLPNHPLHQRLSEIIGEVDTQIRELSQERTLVVAPER
jgi:hypothetical protein